MKKLKSVLLPIALVSLLFAGCQPAAQQEEEKNVNDKYMSATFVVGSLNKKELPFYFGDADTPVQNVDVYIPVNQSTGQEIVEIPYVDVAEWLIMGNTVSFGACEPKTEVISPTKVKIYRTQENSYGAEFDSQAQTIYYQDFDAFNRKSDKDSLISMEAPLSSAKYLKNMGNSFNRYGKAVTVDLGKYGIQMVIQDGKVYLPLSTFNTIFGIRIVVAYNKSGLFCQYTAKSNKFYDENSGKNDRSEDLASFNYRDLCLAMDFLYGLKESHGITDFHEYFCETGLIEKLLGTASDSTVALLNLLSFYIADYHSSMNTASYYCDGSLLKKDDIAKNPVVEKYNKLTAYYQGLRDSVWETKGYAIHKSPTSGEVNDYCEDGDTAFITFDHFRLPTDPRADPTAPDYFDLTNDGTKDLEYDYVSDTIGLIIYAHQQIKKNTSIKNVVIDDSLNGGGDFDAMFYVMSWLLGETPFSIKNVISGGMCSTPYMADVNLDGEFDAEDSLQGLGREINIFCVTSGASFSCGNALPAVLKESGMATILGMKSGGGACAVKPHCTADGAAYNMSGPYQMCTVKNGSFYQIDQGIEPDYSITDLRNVYNRTTLASFIKNRVIYSSGSRISHE